LEACCQKLTLILSEDVKPQRDPILETVQRLWSTMPHLSAQTIREGTRVPKLLGIARGVEAKRERYWANTFITRGAHNDTYALVFKELEFRLYRRLIEAEISLASGVGLAYPKSVLFVGCGAFPITAIMLSMLTGASVTLVERSYEDYVIAKEVLKTAKLERCSIINKDIREINDLSSFDIVWTSLSVGSTVEDKAEYINQIVKNVGKKSLVLCRNPSLPASFVYSTIDESLLNFRPSTSVDIGDPFASLMTFSRG